MTKDTEKLLRNYRDWMFSKIETRYTANADTTEITLPILDRNNDYIQIYLKETEPDRYLLTDDGYTISDLELSGCMLNTEKRQKMLKDIVNGFGVKLGDENELTADASSLNFPQKINNLIQAILAVDDLSYLSSPNVNSIFISDIKNWLREKNVRFSPNISLQGKNEIFYSFDILIPASSDNKAPERFIESFGNFSLQQAEALAYRWKEVSCMRSGSMLYVIFKNKSISKKVEDICRAENMRPVRYSEIDSISQEITA